VYCRIFLGALQGVYGISQKTNHHTKKMTKVKLRGIDILADVKEDKWLKSCPIRTREIMLYSQYL
jgi:hypothetical protein